MSVREKGRGSVELEKLLRSLQDVEITVGIHGDEGGQPHGEDGQTIASIAESHELGLGVPTRSWLRGWVDENQTQNAKDLRNFGEQAIRTRQPSPVVAEQLALRFAGSIQKRIARTGAFQPNAQATIDKKGSSRPLIDSGVMRSAITAKVKKR